MTSSLEQLWSSLSEWVPRQMEKNDVPGVVVGILHGDETYTAGFGVTNVDHPLSVTDETLFQIGSITKTFTTTALMRLVERDELDLDAPVRTYVPDFRVADEAASSQVTLRHIVTHVSGWFGDFFHDTGSGDDAIRKYVAAMADLEQVTPFGAFWSYNNAGFSLAGYVIETVTGKPYEAALAELVLEPLGLERAFFDPGDIMTYRFAVGHRTSEEGPEVARPWPLPRSAYPAGGITCSVHDLLRYARFHMGDGTTEDGTRVLTQDSLALMQTPQTTIRKDEAIGLSWFLRTIDGTRLVSHGGGTTGQVSHLALIPEHHLAIAVFTNADEGNAVTGGVTDRVLEDLLGVKAPKPEPIEVSEEELATYAGRYTNPFNDAELGILNGRLVGQVIYRRGFPSQDSPPPPPPPPAALAPCEENRLLVLDGPAKDDTIDILRKPDGTVGWLRMGGRILKRQDR
ncbi:MAG: serine hydrolase domain-containing protein [Anaerolineae bacterium]